MSKIQNNSMTTRVYINESSSGSSNNKLSDIFTSQGYDYVKYKKEAEGTNSSISIEPIDESRMAQAVRLNEMILKHSRDAHLVVTNLPRAKGVVASDFMEYVNVITEGLDYVLLLRGSGSEVVTTFA